MPLTVQLIIKLAQLVHLSDALGDMEGQNCRILVSSLEKSMRLSSRLSPLLHNFQRLHDFLYCLVNRLALAPPIADPQQPVES